MILITLCLIFANDIVIAISGNPPLRKSVRENFSTVADIEHYVSDFGFVNDILDSFFVFIRVDAELVEVVLIGDNDWYCAPLTLKASGRLVGGEFSTIPLENGEYELFIHITINENDIRLLKTNIRIIKDNNGIRERTPMQVSNFQHPIEQNVILINDTNVYMTDADILSVNGVFVEEDMPTLLRNVYIELKNTNGDIVTYEATSIARTDIAEHFDRLDYVYSGFTAEIPIHLIEEWEHFWLSVIIKNDGKLSTNDYSRIFSLNELIIVSGLIQYTSERVSDFINLPPASNVDGNLDSVSVEKDNLRLTGWFLMNNTPAINQNIFIELKSTSGEVVTFDSISMTNNAIAEHFDNTNFLHSGFRTEIPLNEIKKWNEFTISIIIECEDEFYIIKTETLYSKNDMLLDN